jgi:hypothetical protein
MKYTVSLQKIKIIMQLQSQPKSMSNLQLELLKLYARDVPDGDLMAIRYMIGLYFAEKATAAMDDFITTNNMTPQQLATMAYEHWRAQNRT